MHDPAHPDEPGLIRSSAQISAITALARAAGFARWIVLALTVGATYLGNAYQTANAIPNILFELAAGGVLAAIFVPTFVAELAHGRERAFFVASSLANLFLLATIPLVAAGIVLGEPLMRAMTAGVRDPVVRAQQVALGAWFLRFFLPQVPLYLLGMVMTGLLHAHRRFVLPAAAPLFSSVVVIGTYLAFRALGPAVDIDTVSRTQLYVLAGGTTAGVVVLTFCQLPAVLRLGVRWRPVLGLSDPSVRRAIVAGAYGGAYVGAIQAGLLVTLVLANRVRGGVVAYQVAFAFFELPNALVSLPVAIAAFPALAERFVHRDDRGYARLLSDAIRTVAFLAFPAAAGLYVAAPALTHAILAQSRTAGAAPPLVAGALRGLAVGLPAYALAQVVARAFWARRRTRPPVLYAATAALVLAAAAVGGTVALSPSGPRALAVLGVSHAAGQWAGLTLAVAILAGEAAGWRPWGDLGALVRTAARSFVMAGCVWAVLYAMAGAQSHVKVPLAVAAGIASYALLSGRTPEARRLLASIQRRR